LLTVALFVPMLFGLYWKLPNAQAALVTTATSVSVTLLIDVFTAGKGFGIFSPVAWGICLGVVSLLTLTMANWLPWGKLKKGK